jgi:hypothetical protein
VFPTRPEISNEKETKNKRINKKVNLTKRFIFVNQSEHVMKFSTIRNLIIRDLFQKVLEVAGNKSNKTKGNGFFGNLAACLFIPVTKSSQTSGFFAMNFYGVQIYPDNPIVNAQRHLH